MGDLIEFLVVDDHPIFRRGLIALIESDPRYRVCAEAGCIAEALAAFEREEPDMVVLDISLGEENGLDLLRGLWSSHPGLRCLVVSIHDEAVYAERALRAHARGYLMKQEAGDVLKEAIGAILDGRIYLSSAFRDRMIESLSGTPKESPRAGSAKLSDREIEVLERVGRGFGASEIAQAMGISVKTVGVYQDHLKRKLGFDSISELRKYAIRWVQKA
jgi:Response regulator containing a CheY-like receiver domain and an HTH DNA-binding domain